MATYRDKGIVLRTKTLRDADRHYVVFTETHGKVLLLAKGSRRGKSKMAPHLGSFGVVDLMVAKGRIVDRLAGAGLATPYRSLIDSLEKTALAQGVLLAVDAMTKRELPEPRIFALLAEWLAALDAGPAPDPGRRHVLFDAAIGKLMDVLGFAIDLKRCVRCRNPLVPEGNAVNVIAGGIECAGCKDPGAASVSPEAIKALRFLRAEPFASAPSLRLPSGVRREVGFITDLMLTTHLEDRFSALHYLKAVA
ncbi:MAG TPA: DNA repair protein RecO [Candidatus Binatia bacterium]|nr:DNA repair protein RecO [Candidatus Binatia bacterium]